MPPHKRGGGRAMGAYAVRFHNSRIALSQAMQRPQARSRSGRACQRHLCSTSNHPLHATHAPHPATQTSEPTARQARQASEFRAHHARLTSASLPQRNTTCAAARLHACGCAPMAWQLPLSPVANACMSHRVRAGDSSDCKGGQGVIKRARTSGHGLTRQLAAHLDRQQAVVSLPHGRNGVAHHSSGAVS